MTTVTFDEIAESRSALADYPEALIALDIIEECDGNLEEAASEILIEAGGEGADRGPEFLEQLARKLRRVICQEEFQAAFVDGFSADLLGRLVPAVMAELALAMSGTWPVALAVAVVMYLLKREIKGFCEGDGQKESEPDDNSDGSNGGDSGVT